jgi:hypothetical protein
VGFGTGETEISIFFFLIMMEISIWLRNERGFGGLTALPRGWLALLGLALGRAFWPAGAGLLARAGVGFRTVA